MKRKNNNMTFIENEDSELEDSVVNEVLIFEDSVEDEQLLISEILEIFFEECSEEIFEEQEGEDKQANEMLLKNISLSLLKKPIFELRKRLHILEK
jgi:hypothetical protein